MVAQMFPRRTKGGVLERVEWELDLETAASFLGAPKAGVERLRLEAEEMQRHFPRWVLTLGEPGAFQRCDCGGPLVFHRGISCAVCAKEHPRRNLPRGLRLAWFGTLPPIGIGSLAKVGPSLQRKPPPGHVVGDQPGIGPYLLVPLVVTYPAGFPSLPVEVSYLPGLFEVAGMPVRAPSHTCHLLSNGVMCLFASGQWRPELTVREVVQQRAYAHAVKLLTYADGRHDSFAIVTAR